MQGLDSHPDSAWCEVSAESPPQAPWAGGTWGPAHLLGGISTAMWLGQWGGGGGTS